MIANGLIDRIGYILAGSVLTLAVLYFSDVQGIDAYLSWATGAFFALILLKYIQLRSTRDASDLNSIESSANG